MERTILHCDCNGFYASVECVKRPQLKKVPMAVCGDPQSRHGIIVAKNELAKKFQIQTAETVWSALKKCPDLVLVRAHHDEYQKYSRMVNAIYQQYTELVEPFGIDESWLDVTGSRSLFGSGVEIADQLRRRVREEIGVTISVGVSFNKIFAKLGSDYKKPDATTVISRERFREMVWPLPVSALLYVGRSARETLNQLRVHTIGELARFDPNVLTQKLGKMGRLIYDYANGRDESPVRSIYDREPVKSVGNGMTFRRDLLGWDDIRLGVFTLADEIAARMRAKGVKCATVQVTVRDPHFRTITRQRPVSPPTFLSREIGEAVMDMMKNCWNERKPVRMLTVTGSHLIDANQATEQMDLFHPQANRERDKRERLEKSIDHLRAKYGQGIVQPGAVVRNDIGVPYGREEDDVVGLKGE